MFPFWQILLAVLCYLVGAIPFGPWIAKRHGIDLKKVGSGNTGAANAIRNLGWKTGLQVLAMDILKGSFAILLAEFSFMPAFLIPLMKVIFGTLAILGHNYSIFQRFKGGKGIATSFGVLLAMTPKVAVLAALLWLGLVALTRISAIGSLGAAAAVPVLMIIYGAPWTYVFFSLLVAVMAFHRHRDNLERISQGTENKL